MATRDAWFDNAKMALVTLVVIGHAWTLLPDEPVVNHLYDFVYLWHIPAFVFVTGYLSRSFAWTRTRLWQLVRTVAVPYVIFECAIALFRHYVGGEEMEDLFLDPHWPLWYLSALFFWRLVTPVFRPLPGGVLVAVAISLGAGLWAGDMLDIARICGLLPFFVLGLKATPQRLAALRRTPVQVAAVAVFAGVLALTWVTDSVVSTEWLFYRARYDTLGESDLDSVLIRGGLLMVGTLATLAFLALLPRTPGWFARMGAASLVVYLFHGFFVKGTLYAGFPEWAEDRLVPALLVVTLGSVALAMLLAWPPVATRLTVLVDPFGYAERHARHAVDLGVTVVAQEDHDAPVLDRLVEQLAEERPEGGPLPTQTPRT
ncbi:acyltransferase family protein [Nocardioides sp. cx-169]|uniref:acyltransferase family protein n=1 Tax=Nocardioides sp. cx-169 TaxID=2899080 RepID=UPI001E64B605|nr:acyltransferase family protein [Nocardioides sp. cx-169]MCD4534143.1 acyltransferase family protein [Nocardioides sp. cx-169]